MEEDTLENTNRLLHDLERKLSFVLTTLTEQSHLSVVVDSSRSGLGRQSIQLSVLRYIKDNNTSDFADLVYADRQQRFKTTFGREYSPANQDEQDRDEKERGVGHEKVHQGQNGQTGLNSQDRQNGQNGQNGLGSQANCLEDSAYIQDLDVVSASPASDHSDDYDDYYEGDFDDTDDMLIPPLPPRLPPRQMDPDKLYGLYDFSGPDPLHCTLYRDEPVFLVNDLDNYWWLVKKMTKLERMELAKLNNEEIFSDDEDGKIGFVPAECLETYGERLARLNCFKNEELEKTPSEMLAGGDLPREEKALPELLIQEAPTSEAPSQSPVILARTGSILKKPRGYRQSNKLVTFENLNDINFDDYSDEIDFADHYFSHEDVREANNNIKEADDKHSEVLSDVYPSEIPLQVTKSARKLDYVYLKPGKMADNESIGSFSPDTPPVKFASSCFDDDYGGSGLRRSLILDRLSRVTSDIREELDEDTYNYYHEFGGTLEDSDLDDEKAEDTVTPLTSLNSLNMSTSPNKVVPEKRKTRPVHDMFMPILGKLDELTEKLAELEHLL